MKYIVFKNPHAELMEAVLFCESLAHRVVAGQHLVVSAGFCNVHGEVWGHSEGLGIASRPGDAALVRAAMQLACNPKPEDPQESGKKKFHHKPAGLSGVSTTNTGK